MRFPRSAARRSLSTLLCAILATCGTRNPQSPGVELKFAIPNLGGVTEDLLLDRFLLDGNPVEPKTLEVRTISPGVHEIAARPPKLVNGSSPSKI